MKYFTIELIESDWSEDKHKLWNENVIFYQKHLQSISPLFTNKARKFFLQTGQSFHDADIHSCKIGNTYSRSGSPSNFVEIEVVPEDSKYLYILRYTKVKNYRCNITSEHQYVDCDFDPPKQGVCDHFVLGWWLYDEVSFNENGNIVHEIVVSGTNTIFIECKHFNYSRKKLR